MSQKGFKAFIVKIIENDKMISQIIGSGQKCA